MKNIRYYIAMGVALATISLVGCSRFQEEDLFDEFTRDEHGNVVMSQEEAEKKVKKLGGYDRLYRIKLEADYLAKYTCECALWMGHAVLCGQRRVGLRRLQPLCQVREGR